MVNSDIKYYMKECYKTAKKHGFWDEDIDKEEMLKICKPMFIAVASVIEKIRGGNEILEAHMEQEEIYDWIDLKLLLIATEIGEAMCAETYKETMEELADIFIRLMDLASFVEDETDLNFVQIVQQKMEVNKGRLYLHGKKC